MNKSTILLIILFLVPLVSAQLKVFHILSQISADGGITSIDPDNDGQINGTYIENGNIWVRENGNVTFNDNTALVIGRSNPQGFVTINATGFTGAALAISGERRATPGAGNDDNDTYLFLRDSTGGETWGLQAQNDGDFGIHELGRATPLLIKANTGKMAINQTSDPVAALQISGVVTATKFAGDGSQLENLTGTAGTFSCSTQSASGAGTISRVCSSGTVMGGGGTCGGSNFLATQPILAPSVQNGWQISCPAGGTVYAICCTIS